MRFGPSPLTVRRWKRRARSLAALLMLAGMAWAAWIWHPVPPVRLPLVHVIDGDSLTLRRDGETLTIRLTGLDAVEYRQDCARADGTRWACGEAARAALATLAERGPLLCDLGTKDRYGRTLAACRTALDDTDLAAEMIRRGWAVATDDGHALEEAEARARRRGIWQGPFVRPADWRAAHERPAMPAASPDA